MRLARPLNATIEDEVTLFSSIAQSRSSSAYALTRMVPLVESAYKAYVQARHPADLVPIALDTLDAERLQGAWSLLTLQTFRDIRSSILGAATRCPYCASGRPTEVDHFLPRSKYPEFSVFGFNLVACCHHCNQHKASTILDVPDVPAFLYPYAATANVFGVCVQVELREVVILHFTPDLPPTRSSEEHSEVKTIESHFRRLKLDELYMTEATMFLSEHREAFTLWYEIGGSEAVHQYLSIDADSTATHLGARHWKTALLRALAGSKSFCEGGFALV